MTNRCLYCYKELSAKDLLEKAGGQGYHTSCSKKFFGTTVPPTIEFAQDEIYAMAAEVVRSQKTVTGVQPKLSLTIQNEDKGPTRFTIVGLWGEYILKPQTEDYKSLPENEDLTMKLAELSRINVVPHSLIRMESGELAYITKRVDRKSGQKLHMEDMCQLTERLTEDKYKGSYEQIAKVIRKYSHKPGLDVVNFFESLVFSFLTGNADMHLKNYSLIRESQGYALCPLYDLINTDMVVEKDDEDLALTLNAKKKKIKRQDFEIALKTAGVDEKVIDSMLDRFQKELSKWGKTIEKSFLSDDLKKRYKATIAQRASRLDLKVPENLLP